MCFSFQADLLVGAASVALGAIAWHESSGQRDRSLATLPVLLGGHLLVEAVVWRGVEGGLPASTTELAVRVYLVIALVVVPLTVPVALQRADRPDRRWRYLPFVALGAIVAAVLAIPSLFGEVGAVDRGLHLAYRVDVVGGGAVVGAYAVATCGAALVASDRRIRAFGVANVFAVIALAVIEQEALISLWCAWAAVTSIVIALRAHRRSRADRDVLGARGMVPAGDRSSR